MQKANYNNPPQSLHIEKFNHYYGVRITANVEELENEHGKSYQADTNFFWEHETILDLEDVKSNPEKYLFYIPRNIKDKYRSKAQRMLDDVRSECPLVPVPSYRADAVVFNRPADQIKLLAGLQMGGLPYFELANDEIVSLTVEDLQKIAMDITNAEVFMQQKKQECWKTIEEAKSEDEMKSAIDAFADALEPFNGDY